MPYLRGLTNGLLNEHRGLEGAKTEFPQSSGVFLRVLRVKIQQRAAAVKQERLTKGQNARPNGRVPRAESRQLEEKGACVAYLINDIFRTAV